MVVVFWILFCILVGIIAHKKGRNPTGYILLSIFLSPLVGIIVVLLVGYVEKENVNTQKDDVEYRKYLEQKLKEAQEKAGVEQSVDTKKKTLDDVYNEVM